jgi:hypothetical protein
MKELLNNLTLIHLLILSFGAYSITRLIVTDDFPMFAKPRKWLHHRFPYEGMQDPQKPVRGKSTRSGPVFYVTEGHWLGELTHCPWCMGWWVSLAAVVGYWFVPEIVLIGLLPFALRAVVGIIASKVGG